MADIDYAAKATTATALLHKFGGPVTLQAIESGGVYNPDTGEFEQTTTDYLTVGAKFNYLQDHIDGTVIQKSDQELYLSAEGIPTPSTSHKIIIGSKAYAILAVQAIEPYDVPLLYILQIRA